MSFGKREMDPARPAQEALWKERAVEGAETTAGSQVAEPEQCVPTLSFSAPALWPGFSVLDYVPALPSARTGRLEHVGAEWRHALEVNLLTGHMEKRILEVGTDLAGIRPGRTLVSAPPRGHSLSTHTGSVSVSSVHSPGLDRMVESVNRRPGCSDRLLERPRPSHSLFDFSRCSSGIWGEEKEFPPGTYSDTASSS